MNYLKDMFLSLSLVLLLALPLDTYASEKIYPMTETELTILEWNLERLRIASEEQKKESENLKTALSTSLDKLEKAKMESVRQSEALIGLKKETERQKTLLEKANQSLAAYAKEEKREKKRLSRQRDLAWGLAAVMLGAYIVKK